MPRCRSACSHKLVGAGLCSARLQNRFANKICTSLICSIFSYTYDQNGNLTTKTVDSEANGASLSLLDNMPESAIYEYDINNRLKKVTTADTIAAYSYLPDGRRASKTVNGVKTSHIWDGNNIVADTKNGILTKYIRSNKLEQVVTGDIVPK